MLKRIVTLLLVFAPVLSGAQDARPFDVSVSNDEYKVYIKMNLYDRNLTVPGQEVLGQVDGYIGSSQGSGKWIIVSSRITGGKTAEIDVVNDYGSEDFTAVVSIGKDGTYSYRKKSGSTLKFAVRGKWQKLPGNMVFRK